ncbi:glycosyltransferase [Spirosoma aerophilum]
MNFIFVSLQQIGTDRTSTSVGIAKELAKNHNVLYVNYPIDRNVLYFRKNSVFDEEHIGRIKSKSDTLVQLEKNLWVLWPRTIIESINWLPSTDIFQVFNWINNKRFADEIKDAIKKLNFDSYIIINDKDIFRSYFLKDFLKPEKYIYLDRDNTVGTSYWKKHGAELEPKLMQKSDIVVCNSKAFTERAKLYNNNSYYIGNGFDTSQYTLNHSLPIPEDLANIPEPRIGYIGALITLRLDLKLLIELAKENTTWNYVFIGWQDQEFEESELHHLPNVFFLGKKHTDIIPAYIQHMDVCINPQVINEITDNNFPLKILEYLAVGKPVVATATNTMQQEFSEYTYLATDKESYVEQIELALNENSEAIQKERMEFAQGFSWENVINKLLDTIKDTNYAFSEQ